jgi:hypothetical protein
VGVSVRLEQEVPPLLSPAQCEKCRFTGPEGESHHHIRVENGHVVRVDYMSGDGYWDRELESSEYFVEYKDV